MIPREQKSAKIFEHRITLPHPPPQGSQLQWTTGGGQIDHTTGTSTGSYAAVDVSKAGQGDFGLMKLSTEFMITDADNFCLEFYYRVDGPLYNQLSVHLARKEDMDGNQPGVCVCVCVYFSVDFQRMPNGPSQEREDLREGPVSLSIDY